MYVYLGLILRKLDFVVCEQQRCRPVCAAHSLISSLCFCSLESILATLATCNFLKILAEQAGLTLHWLQTLNRVFSHLGSINYVLQVLSYTEILISYKNL